MAVRTTGDRANARMENGTASPNLGTILKVLASLGKTLYIGDL